MTQESYQDRLRRHSSESRHDPLRDAARSAVSAWWQEDDQEKNDLSENFWRAMGELEATLVSVKRGGEEDVPEVEVTYDRSPVPVEVPETPLPARRSGAKNISAPEYQKAFVDEARHSMGQPSKADCDALVDKMVIIEFNDDQPPVQGLLQAVTSHPTQRTYVLVVKLQADLPPPGPMFYPLNSVQAIRSI